MELLDPTDIPLRPRLAGCPVPLTAGQLWLWDDMIKRGTRLSEWRMCAASVRILGPLNTCLMRRSIEAVVQRHESLRTRIIQVDGIPRQHIDAASDDHFEVIDLAKVSPINVQREAKHVAQEFIEEKIDLSVGPLFDAKLLRLSNREHVLILALDHIVSDAVSYGILSRDIWTLYNQAAQGLPFSLPQLPVQFADYAVWQQRTYDAWLKKHEAYWRGRLTGAPRIQLPLGNGLAEVKHPTVSMLHIPFGKALSAKLRDVARRERTLLPLVVLTVYAAVVSRWCSQGDLVLGFASHGRHSRPELENMIGFLATGLLLRIEITKEESFLDLLKRVNLEFYSACNHQGIGRLRDIVPECTIDVGFNWITTNWSRRSVHQKGEADGPVKMQPFPIQTFRSVEAPFLKFVPLFSDTAAGIIVTVLYRPDLFAKSTIERFGHSLRLFAAEFTQRPLASVASIAVAP